MRVLLFIALNIVGVGVLAAPYLTITPQTGILERFADVVELLRLAYALPRARWSRPRSSELAWPSRRRHPCRPRGRWHISNVKNVIDRDSRRRLLKAEI